MKRLFAIAIFCVAVGFVQGQVVPNTSTTPSSVSGVNAVPAAYDETMKINFIRNWIATKPYTTESDVTSGSRTIQEVKQTTQYFDGLGRPLQTVSKQISPLGKDMVAAHIYDSLGREQYQYLPYVAIDSNTTNGLFKRNPFNEQASFFSNATYNPGLSGEQVYYSKTMFEASPLNRVDTAFAPGNSWGGSHVGVVSQSLINTAADSVRIWTISAAIGSNPSSSSYYAAGLLYKNVMKDEHGKQVVEYKDKEGKVLLKKVQLDASPSTHHTGWLCTYYIYDDLDHLRYVIQPKGVELRTGNWGLSSTILNELCFRYEYDARNRMIIKKAPGAGEVWMVYDVRDRLVMSQDSSLRAAGEWLCTNYDTLNRPIRTFNLVSSSNRTTHQSSAESSTIYPAMEGTYTLLTETYYDHYYWVSGSGSGLSSTFISTYASNTSYFYTASNSTFPYPQSITPFYITLGMITGTKTRVLGTSDFIYTTNFYDDRGRVIQSHSTNNSGGKDTVTMQYSFSGQLLRSLVCHDKSGTNAQGYKLLTKNEYDGAGRLTKVSKKTGNSTETIIAENSYNELGQLKKKQIGLVRNSSTQESYTSDPLDSINYSYNIRGWLRGINKDYARASNNNSWFGMELTYDFGFSQAQLNGNIAGIRWRSKGDGEQRAYGFTYDAVNRFMQADFTQYTSSAWNTTAGIDFTVKNMSYDANGNILTMTQKGWKLTGSAVIDSLIYGYNSSSNKLDYVTDKTNDATTKLGDFKETTNNTSQDYWYDGNGNLQGDNNKAINSIIYNYLNLPAEIKVNGKGKINYTYDAAGTKLRKTTVDSTASPVKITITDYIGSFIYQNDTLQFAGTEEGRVRPKRANYSDTMYYDYFEKDHLGNVRVILTDELKTDAYPVASLETTPLASERLYYSKVDSGRINKSTVSGYPTDTYTNPNDFIQKLSGNEVKVGTGTVLKVMAGDKVSMRVNSWWNSGDTPGTPVSPLNDLLSALSGSIGSLGGSHPTSGEITSSGVLSDNATNFLNSQSGYTTSKPKAFLNWILFDERFAYVSSSSGFEQVGTSNTFTTHTPSELSVNKSGYLYVYVGNETPNINVFFDNLQVTHIRGPLLEETHYYPFGLAMADISSKALAFGKENKYKFNVGTELDSKEFSDGSGLELYATDFRRYDAQIGRFTGIDALSAYAPNQSPYSFVQNNPISFVDPQGLDTVRVNGEGSHKIKIGQGDVLSWTIGKTTSYYTYDPSNPDAVGGFVGAGIQNDESLPEVRVTAKAKPQTESGGSNLKDQTFWGLDAGFTITETSRATFRLTNGTANGNILSPKWYSPSSVTGRGWGGGSKAGIKTFKVSSAAKVGSWGLFGVGVVLDGIGVYKYYTAPNTDPNAFIQPVHPAKAGLNTGIGLYSLYVNPVVGIIYFGTEAFYPGGVKGVVKDQGKTLAGLNEICNCDASASFYY